MIEVLHKKIYKLTCEWQDCRHVWESGEVPIRCSGCKRRTWNSGDNRANDKKASLTPPKRKGPRKTGMKFPKPTRVRALDEA